MTIPDVRPGVEPQPAPLFPPPADAVAFVPGDVMHARFRPKPHRFAYRVANLLIDCDRLDEAGRASPFFSIGRFNLFSFHPADHGPCDGSPLSDHVRCLLAPDGIDIDGGRVLLLAYPRVLGYVFNPISVFYAYDRTDELRAVIYEVRNTFGDMHTYVCPVRPGELSEAGLRQERDKLLYVSPFLGMGMRYRFRLRPPGERLAVRILETDENGPILAATFHGTPERLTTGRLVRAFVRLPLLTLKVMAGIHWEALRLWLKGVKFHARPAPPPPVSHAGPGGGFRLHDTMLTQKQHEGAMP